MPLRITLHDRELAEKIRWSFEEDYLPHSRFEVNVIDVISTAVRGKPNRCQVGLGSCTGGWGWGGISLKKRKDNCGNHPGPCVPIFFGNGVVFRRPHKRNRYLEGSDWVAFNNMVNDCLDALDVEADAGTSAVVIRRGRLRRIHYGSRVIDNRGHQDWDKLGSPNDYADYCLKPSPESSLPEGTPGEIEWRELAVS